MDKETTIKAVRDAFAAPAISLIKRPVKKVKILNGDRFCAQCGEFLSMTCDPFGRSECGSGCFDGENDE
jgi:hypothetical protein